MTETKEKTPPGLDGEEWRTTIMDGCVKRTYCIAPGPFAESPNLLVWRHRAWIEGWASCGGDESAPVFRAWALHLRDVAAAERAHKDAACDLGRALVKLAILDGAVGRPLAAWAADCAVARADVERIRKTCDELAGNLRALGVEP